MVLDNIGIQPVSNLGKVGRSHHPIHFVARQACGLEQKNCQEPGIDVPRFPESNGQRVVGLDLRGELPYVTMTDAELIVSSAPFFVLCTDVLVAERLQLRQGFLESHCHTCSAPWGCLDSLL